MHYCFTLVLDVWARRTDRSDTECLGARCRASEAACERRLSADGLGARFPLQSVDGEERFELGGGYDEAQPGGYQRHMAEFAHSRMHAAQLGAFSVRHIGAFPSDFLSLVAPWRLSRDA